MEYFYSICRVPREVIVAGQRTAHTLRYAKHLSVNDRMLHYVICYVLIPKDSNHSQISDLEMQIMFAIKNKIKINWILTMMYHLRQQISLSTRLPYGRLISSFLEKTDLDLNREPTIVMKENVNEINSITIIKNTGIIRSGPNTYRYRDSESASPSNYTIPEGGITNEFLYITMMNQHRETTRAINSLRQLVLDSQDHHEENVEEDEEGSEEMSDEE